LFAAGIAVFGHTDLGVVAPVLLASIVTTALIFVFVRRFIDPAAAWWCALLYACEPFNVVNSTTMTNDVILACLTFGSLTVFLAAERTAPAVRRFRLFVAAGLLMFAAFLVKITFLPILLVVAGYSTLAAMRRRADVIPWHSVFYGTFALGLLAVCVVYYVLKGDLLWQFKSEAFYYETYKPDWYLAGAIDYPALMWQYPRSLLGLSGFPGFRYLEHGLLFWLVLPASIAVLVRGRSAVLKLLVVLVFVVFAFFEFYPQYLSPYLPLVRQERYLELLLAPAVIVAGTTLYRISRRHRALAAAMLSVLLLDFVVEAARRSLQYDDSQQDMRELAMYARSTLSRTGQTLAVDRPAANALSFYLRGAPVKVTSVGRLDRMELRNCYVAVGGARSFWWSRDEVIDITREAAPPYWVLAYEVAGRPFPWRPSNLRVYYVGEPPANWFLPFDAPLESVPEPLVAGLIHTAHPDGFDTPGLVRGMGGTQIPDLDNSVPLPASRLQWTGWLRAEDALYTFESSSDDGSWIHVNGRLLLDNGGTHPAIAARRTVRLSRGWYAFRLRYEDTGGDRFLRVRVYKNYEPVDLEQEQVFFSSPIGQNSPRRPDQ
jgi:4-amino-4-deoxy-L-arabinose transferase-like glycosyltransferase